MVIELTAANEHQRQHDQANNSPHATPPHALGPFTQHDVTDVNSRSQRLMSNDLTCYPAAMVNWKIPLANLNGPTPVKTPDGRVLRTLEDAAVYATGLGKAKVDKDPLWRFAIKQIMWAAESEQPLPFTTNAVREAIYGKAKPEPLPSRPSKDEIWREKRKKARQR